MARHKNHKKDTLGIMASMPGVFSLNGMMSDLVQTGMSITVPNWEEVATLWVETFGLAVGSDFREF